MDIKDKLDEIHKEVREGNASLHQRHDRADSEISFLHHKMDKIKGYLYTVWKAVLDVFKKDIT